VKPATDSKSENESCFNCSSSEEVTDDETGTPKSGDMQANELSFVSKWLKLNERPGGASPVPSKYLKFKDVLKHAPQKENNLERKAEKAMRYANNCLSLAKSFKHQLDHSKQTTKAAVTELEKVINQ